MRIALIGAGHIGGNLAARWSRAGHDVMISFSRSPENLEAQAREVGAGTGSPADAVAFGEVVVVSVPLGALDDALAQAGSLAGRTVIDTTNQYARGGLVTFPGGGTAAAHNAARFAGAHYAKAFNTLGSAVQRAAGAGEPLAMFYAAADEEAAVITDVLVAECGFVPARLPWARVGLLEAPARPGAVYNERYRPADAAAIVAAADPARAADLALSLRAG